MSLSRDSVIRRLRRVISSLKFVDIEEAVLPSFPELTWSKLRKTLLKNDLGLTVSGTIKIIEKVIQEREIPSATLRDRLRNLELIAISRDSTRRHWTCWELRGKRSSAILDSDQEIQEKISSSFRKSSQQMDVRVTSHDGITFVSATTKNKRPSKRAGDSIYYAFSNEQNYLFTSKKVIPKDYLLAVTQGLGYTNSKLANLSGKHLKSLITLLWAKQQGSINKDGITNIPAYTSSRPVVRRTGVDFTESKQREEYVDKYFGSQPPHTEMLDLTITNARWKRSESVAGLDDESFDVKVEFRSNHIPNMIKELVKRQVVKVPLPAYASDLLTIGKNEMTLRSHS